MLEEAAEHAEDPDVLRQVRHPGPQAAQAADVERDRHPRLAGAVELADDLGVLQLVHLGADPGRLPGGRVLRLAADHLDETRPHETRRHQQDVVVLVRRRARELVEHRRHVRAEVGVAAQDAEVLVHARGPTVVVAGADVNVAPDPVVLLAHDHRQLDVGLQLLDAVRDVNALLLEEPAPRDVRRLVEAGGDLNQHRHLLAAPGCFRQGLDDRRVGRRAVDRQLDGEHPIVHRRRLQETEHRGVEAVVRVVEKNVAAPDLLEDRRRIAGHEVAQSTVRDADVRRKSERRVAVGRESHQVGHAEKVVVDRDVHFVELQLLNEELPDLLRRALGHLQPDLAREATRLEVVGDLADDAARLEHSGLCVRSRDLPVVAARGAGDAEQMRVDRRGRKQLAQVGGDDLLERHEAGAVAQGHPPCAIRGDLEPHETLLALGFSNRDRQVESEVGDEGKRVLGVHGERRQDRQHRTLEVLAEVGAVVVAEVGPVDDAAPGGRHRGTKLLAHQLRQLPALTLDLLPARFELLARSHAIERQLVDAFSDLPLEAADALHEELVVQHAEDAGESHPFQERHLGILRELQDPVRESQPAEFAVDESCRRLRSELL